MIRDIDHIIEKALKGDKYSVSRLISSIERDDEHATKILERIYPRSGDAFYLGITGPPGAGKSTLVDRIVCQYSDANIPTAVIAVDPSSPFTGGSLLGDRIRMKSDKAIKNCFFRSMSAGKMVGGLARTTKEASWVLAASGRKVIIIETVGVGQSELDIMNAADSVLVALTPESGDGIQLMKSGLLEIADIFVINKADRPGAEEMRVALEEMLDQKERVTQRYQWRPPVICTSADRGENISELYENIVLHCKYLQKSKAMDQRRVLQYKSEILREICREVLVKMNRAGIDDSFLTDLSTVMKDRNRSPHNVAKALANEVLQTCPKSFSEKDAMLKELISVSEDNN